LKHTTKLLDPGNGPKTL